MRSLLIYTLRPTDNTPLWLPEKLCSALGVSRGDKLTEAQFGDARVRDLLRRRLESKSEPPLE